jgi:hypothetical protein
VTGDWDEPLDALRWHWGEAYVINCLGLGRWTAERRDTHETLRDHTPLGLRDKIIADYSARKVPRHSNGHLPSEPEPGPGPRWSGLARRCSAVPCGYGMAGGC